MTAAARRLAALEAASDGQPSRSAAVRSVRLELESHAELADAETARLAAEAISTVTGLLEEHEGLPGAFG